MLQATTSPRLQPILQASRELSQAERLELIARLQQEAQQIVTPTPPLYTWQDVEGILDEPLTGMDAQEWVSKIRDEEWERDLPR